MKVRSSRFAAVGLALAIAGGGLAVTASPSSAYDPGQGCAGAGYLCVCGIARVVAPETSVATTRSGATTTGMIARTGAETMALVAR